MPDGRRKRCRVCGKHADDVGPISWRGKCGACGPMLANANADDLHYHRGEGLQRWRRGMIRCAGGIDPDDAEGLEAWLREMLAAGGGPLDSAEQAA